MSDETQTIAAAPAQPVAPEAIHTLRKDIDQRIVDAQNFQSEIGRGSGGREISIVVTKLQEAKMWAGKILEAFGSELPAQYQDKAETPAA